MVRLVAMGLCALVFGGVACTPFATEDATSPLDVMTICGAEALVAAPRRPRRNALGMAARLSSATTRVASSFAMRAA